MITLAGPTRLELATSALTGQRSNQLSYDSIYSWSERRDSNPRPTAWQAVILPSELLPRLWTWR